MHATMQQEQGLIYNHEELLIAIKDAQQRVREMFNAYQHAALDDASDAFHAYQVASSYADGLNSAGWILIHGYTTEEK